MQSFRKIKQKSLSVWYSWKTPEVIEQGPSFYPVPYLTGGLSWSPYLSWFSVYCSARWGSFTKFHLIYLSHCNKISWLHVPSTIKVSSIFLNKNDLYNIFSNGKFFYLCVLFKEIKTNTQLKQTQYSKTWINDCQQSVLNSQQLWIDLNFICTMKLSLKSV